MTSVHKRILLQAKGEGSFYLFIYFQIPSLSGTISQHRSIVSSVGKGETLALLEFSLSLITPTSLKMRIFGAADYSYLSADATGSVERRLKSPGPSQRGEGGRGRRRGTKRGVCASGAHAKAFLMRQMASTTLSSLTVIPPCGGSSERL